MLFDLREVRQIYGRGEFGHIEGFSVNDLAALCECYEQVLPLLSCRNDESGFLADEDCRRGLRSFLARLKLDHQVVFHGSVALRSPRLGQLRGIGSREIFDAQSERLAQLGGFDEIEAALAALVFAHVALGNS
jgi:hypothetical protein